MPKSDFELVEQLLVLCRDLEGIHVADAVGVTPGNVSKWRKGNWRGNLHARTRARIEEILSQPGWQYVPSAPPTEAEEREAERMAAYAAGVLWSIARDAEQLAQKAREAHAHITGESSVDSGKQPKSGAIRPGTRGTLLADPGKSRRGA